MDRTWMSDKFWLRLIILVCFAAILRLTYLGIIPPGTNKALWLRFPSATAGILSVALLILLTHKLTQQTKLSLLSGFFLAINPWHIEQSRMYSPAMLGLTVLLSGVYVFLLCKKPVSRLFISIVTMLIFYAAYPTFWIFRGIRFSLTLSEFIQNLFRLVSVDFLFYHNDSYWAGGFRNQGALLVSYLPLLLFGIWYLLTNFKIAYVRWLIIFLILWMIAASSPLFPEQREYFLTVPYLVVVLAYGTLFLLQKISSGNTLVKSIFIAFTLCIIYEQTLFIHWYTVHYNNRIKNERTYEMEIF